MYYSRTSVSKHSRLIHACIIAYVSRGQHEVKIRMSSSAFIMCDTVEMVTPMHYQLGLSILYAEEEKPVNNLNAK